MKSARAYTIGSVVAVLLIVLLGVVRAWAITVLWDWFVVPTFGLPEISKVTAFGLGAFVSLFTKYEVKEKNWDDGTALMGTILGELFGGVISALLVVGICWVVKLFA